MQKQFKRVANIDDLVKDMSMPYLHWKILFLTDDSVTVEDLHKLVNEDQKKINTILDDLVKKGLLEIAEEEIVQKEDEEEKKAEPEEKEPAQKVIEESETIELEEETEKADESEEPDTTQEQKEEIVKEEADSESKKEEKEAEVEKDKAKQEEEEVTDFASDLGDLEQKDTSEAAAQEETETKAEQESVAEEVAEKEEAEEVQEKKQPEEDKEKKEPETKTAEGQKSLMVIDDSIVIRKMVEIALEEEDFKLLNTNSGKEAMKLLDEENPSLVVLDMMLPDMNGIDLLKTIKASKGVPVIMLSGKDAPQLVESAKEAGADDFLPKPFRDEDLVSKVKKLLG